jgi:ubiquitin carboxyl-terminal hydrolase 4/11/15
MTEEYSHKFYKVWSDTETLGKVQQHDILIMHELPYEIDQPAYRPTKGKTPEEEGKIFVTVVNMKTPSASSNSYQSRNLFGKPFILALTAEEACDVNKIEEKLCERLESWEGVGKKIWSTPSPSEAGSKSSVKPSSRPVIADDEEDAPLVENSKDTEMEDAPTTASDLPRSDTKAPNRNAVSFQVAKKPFANYDSKPFLDTIANDRYTLQERLADVLAHENKPSVTHTPLPGSFNQDEVDDLYGDTEEEPSEKTIIPETPETSISPIPILRTGETILVEWNARFATECFGTDADKSRNENTERFAKQERIVEPALAVRRKLGNTKADKAAITIENLLDEFVKEEKLSEDNMWYCSSCKKHQEAPKKFDLWKMPDVLVIHLKRFSNERAFRDKIDTFIDFPVNGLDLTDRVEGKKVAAKLAAEGDAAELIEETGTNDSLVYDLFAVDNHFGGREWFCSLLCIEVAVADESTDCSWRWALHCICQKYTGWQMVQFRRCKFLRPS